MSKNMGKKLIIVMSFFVGLLLAKPSFADALQIQCTSPTVCTAGGIQTTTNSSGSFNLVLVNGKYSKYAGDTAYIVELTPSSSGQWAGTPSTLEEFLGFTGKQHNYSSTLSFSPSSGGFDVQLFNLGLFTSSKSFPYTSVSQGTIFVGLVVSGNKTILTTPWSESLDVTTNTFPTPEPSSLLLLGTGLLGLGAGIRRRFIG